MKIFGTFKSVSKALLPLLFGGLILWLLYRNMDFAQLVDVLRSDANYLILLGSLLFGLGANIVRGLRWDILIRSLGESPSRYDSVLTVLGNYAVNMALPRMGEVWRCAAMSHRSGISFSKLFGTLLVDRASDFVIVGLLVALTSLGNLGFFTTFFSSHSDLSASLTQLVSSPWLYTVAVLLLLLCLLLWRFGKDTPLVLKSEAMLLNVWEGLRTIDRLEQKWLFILYSALLWVGYFCFFYTTFYAFSFTEHLGVRIGLITFIMSSIAVAAPVQAGMGAWHFMVIYTLTFFGVAKADAGSFALIVHAVQTLWTTGCGLVAIALLSAHRRPSRKLSA